MNFKINMLMQYAYEIETCKEFKNLISNYFNGNKKIDKWK